MKAYLNNIWWMLVVRGLLLLVFGFIAIFWPGLTAAAFITVFALYIILAGVIGVVTSLVGVSRSGMWFLDLLLGVFQVGIGIYAVKNPGIAIATLIVIIGLTFVVRGIFEIVSAFTDEAAANTKALTTVLGLLSLAAGVVVWFYPAASGLAFVWIVGAYAIISGPILIALGLDAKALANRSV